jgi:hypothetical protein
LKESIKADSAIVLSNYLSKCLDTDWVYLQKYDYNLLVAAQDLCQQIISISWDDIPYQPIKALERLHRLEDNFYLFHSYPKIKQDLYNVLKESLSHHKEAGIKPHILMKKILEPDIVMPSLFDTLYSLSMLESRKYIERYSLFQELNTNPIVTTVFEASSEIKRSILDHLNAIENELAPLVRQNLEVLNFNSMIPVKPDGHTDLSHLEYFYEYLSESEKDAKKANKFSKECLNVPFFMFQICKKLIHHFQNFLSGEITIYEQGNPENAHKVKLFDNSIFEMQLRQIDRLHESLDRLSAMMPTFSRDRYLKLKLERKGAIQTETSIINEIDEVLLLCVQMGQSLHKIVQLDDQLEEENMNFIPLNSSDLQKYSLHLPFSKWLIRDISCLNDRSVAEACTFISYVTMVLAVYMKETDITQSLYRFEKIKGRIKNFAVQLKRLSSPLQFQQFTEHYQLPLV